MCKKSLYEVLQVDKEASPEAIAASYQQIKARYNAQFDEGDLDARTNLTILQEAYDVLRSPERRKQYDQAQANPAPRYSPVSDAEYAAMRSRDSVFLKWWKDNLTGKLFLALVFFGAIFAFYKFAGQNKGYKVESNRVENEKTLVEGAVKVGDGVVKNQDKLIDKSYDIASRNAEMRKREMDSVANAREELLAQRRRMQEEAIRHAEWSREQAEKRQAEIDARNTINRDKQALCNIYASSGRYAEARSSGCYSR